MEPNICVVIPCWNEEETIIETLKSLANQRWRPDLVICIDDCSTDKTYELLTRISSSSKFTFRIIAGKTTRRSLRAGAINVGLELVPRKYKLIVLMDADTLLDKDAIGNAVAELTANSDAGMICSTSFVREGHGLLYRLQKLEYGGITHTRYLTRSNVLISHGLFSMIRRDVLMKVGWRLSERMLLEDYDLTVQVKLQGYRCIFSPQVRAYTKVPKTWKSLYRQRKRWSVGGLDVVTKYGWVNPVKTDIFSHILFLVLFFAILDWVLARMVLSGPIRFGFHPVWEPWFAIPVGVAIMGYVYNLMTMRFVPNRDWKDWLIRLTLLFEVAYTIFLSAITLYSYVYKITARQRSW